MLDPIFRRWPLKLLALFLAFLIWLAVTGQNRVLQDYNVPLDIQLGADAILVGPTPTRVSIRLRGPEAQLKRLDPYRMRVAVDLGDAPPGERMVALQEEQVEGVPAGLEVEILEPTRLTLQVEVKSTKSVPVAASFVGKPATGYAFYGARVLPDVLEIVGPEAEIEATERVRTDAISLDGRRESFSLRVGAVPDGTDVRLLNPRPVEVRVEIDQAPEERRFEGVPVVLAGQVYEATVTPAQVNIVLSGPPDLLERIGPTQLRAVADVSELAPRKNPYQVLTRLEFVDVPARDLARLSEKSTGRRTVTVRLMDRRISE